MKNGLFVIILFVSTVPFTLKANSQKKDIWSGEVSAGFDRRRGNNNDSELLGEFLLIAKTMKHEWMGKIRGYYSETQRKMDAQQYEGLARFARYFSKARHWYHFYSFEADHDRFANIDTRYVPSGGIGYLFKETEKFKAFLEGGPGYSHTEFRDNTRDA